MPLRLHNAAWLATKLNSSNSSAEMKKFLNSSLNMWSFRKSFVAALFMGAFGAFTPDAAAQCSPPAACPTCVQDNPAVVMLSQEETCAGLADGQLQFFALVAPTWTFPVNFEWYSGTTCVGAPISAGTLDGGGTFAPAGSELLSGLSQGEVYTLVIYDGTFYQEQDYTVQSADIPPNQPVISINPTGTTLCPGDTRLFTAAEGSGTQNWNAFDSLRWYQNGVLVGGPNQATTNNTFTANGPGAYYATVDDGSGCLNTSDTIVLTVSPLQTVEDIRNVDCAGGNTGRIEVTVTGGSPGYTYTWSNGAGDTPINTGLQAGDYTVTIADANSCDTIVTYNVTEPPAIAITFPTINEPSCDGDCDGTVISSATGGSGTLTYTWSSPWGASSTMPTQANVCQGNLTLTITDDSLCTEDSTIVINAPPPLALNTDVQDVLCFGANDGWVSAEPSGGTAPYSYGWSNGGAANGTASDTIQPLAAGTYTVTVVDDNGCDITGSETVADATPLVCGTAVINPTCPTTPDGEINLTVVGGASPYTFDWSNDGTGDNDDPEDLNSLVAGTYTVTVTDANGCTCTSSETLTPPNAGSATLTTTDPTCAGDANGAIDATNSGGTMPYTFDWSNDGAGDNDDPEDLTGLTAGTYTLTVTDDNGCMWTEQATLIDPAPIVLDTATTSETCSAAGDGTATVTGVGGTGTYDFQWSTGTIDLGTASSTETGLGRGTYTVTATDANGCMADTTVIVNGPDFFNATVTPTNLTCNGVCTGEILVTVAGGVAPHTYDWTGAAAGQGANPTGLCAGSYDLTITDNNGCDTLLTQAVTEPAQFVLNTVFTDPPCGGIDTGSASITVVSGGTPMYNFAWSTGQIDLNTMTSSVSNLAGGGYDVTITDAAGCDSVVVFNLTQAPPLTVDTANVVPANCVGLCTGSADAVTAGGTGVPSITWHTPGTFVQVGAGATIGSLCAGDNLLAIATDANGCMDTTAAFALDTSVTIDIVLNVTDESCLGDGDGEIGVTETGGTLPYTYDWTNDGVGDNDDSDPVTGLTSGTYTVTVADANGCFAVDSATVSAGVIIDLVTDSTDVTCAGADDGTTTVTPSGGSLPYTYLWNDVGAQTTPQATGLPGGTYCVTVTDAGGCSADTCITISEPAGVGVAMTSSDVNCFGDSDGTATAAGSGGTPAYTYAWSAGVPNTNATITGLPAGTYTVTVTDNIGCTITDSVDVDQPTLLVTSQDAQTNNDCFGTCLGSATVGATGGTGAYTYDWAASITAGPTEIGMCAGDFTVTVSDANGCTGSEVFTITEGVEMTFNQGVTDEACDGADDGSAGVEMTGGTGPFGFAWPAGQTNDTIFNQAPGTYTVTITDALLCDTTATLVIAPAPNITANISATDEACLGAEDGTATVVASGGTGAFTYTWDDPDTQTTPTATGLGAGTYNVTVEDANACDTVLSVTVDPGIDIAATVTTNDNTCGLVAPNCIGDATVSVTTPMSGTITYLWDAGAGSQTSATATGLCGGAYDVTVTHVNSGCAEVFPAVLSDIGGETITVNTVTGVDCAGDCNGSADVSNTCADPPCTLLWLDSTATQIPAYDNQTNVTGMCGGQYFLQLTNNSGCITIDSLEVPEPSPISANDSLVQVECNGDASGEIFLSPSGGTGAYTYMWSGGLGSNPFVQNLSAGDYTVTLSDANACDTVFTFTITEPAAITISSTSSTDITCFGDNDGTLTASASGGTAPLTYTWVTSPALVFEGTGSNLTGRGPGDYLVSVSDANGCSVTSGVETITEPGQLVIGTTVTDILCNGDNNGQIAAAVNAGGTPSFTFNWSNGQSGPIAVNLIADTYTVTVTDANNCTETATEILTDPAALTLAVTVADLACADVCDGQATANPGGGTMPYTYDWDAQGTNQTISGQCAGTYSVTVSDANGCSVVQDPVTISAPAAIDPGAVVTDETCFGDCDGSIVLNATGGTGTLDYDWNTGSSATSISGLCPGTYTVTITDDNLCDTIETYTVAGNPAITGPIVKTDATCGASDGDATITAGGGAGAPYTITWFDAGFTGIGQTGATATGLSSGIYRAIVQDGGLVCQDTFSITINDIGADTIDVQDSIAVSCNGLADGEISAGLVAPQSPPLTFEWFILSSGVQVGGPTVGVLNDTVRNLGANTYLLQVTNGAGCVTSEQIIVNEPTPIRANATVVDPNCANSNDGSITLNAGGGNGPAYTYAWSIGGGGAVQNGLDGGTYTVTITETGPNACNTDTTIILTAPPAINAALTVNDVTCFGNSDGGASVVASGGQGVLTYTWTDALGGGGATVATGTTVTSITGRPAGPHSLIVADATGICDTTISFMIGTPTAVAVDSVTATTNPCFGNCIGNITVAGSGGTGPYDYDWDNGQITPTAVNLCAGSYVVTVTDDNGCDVTRTLVMTEGLEITMLTGTVDETCAGDADGAAGVEVTGGSGPFDYLWDFFGSTNDTITGLTPGTYNITVTDNNGCDSTVAFTVNGNALLTGTASVVNLGCNGDTDGIATVTPTGGVGPYDYQWDVAAGSQITPSATGLAAGTYDVTVTDFNLCTWDTTLTITEPAAMTSTFSNNPATCQLVPCDGDATVVPAGGSAPYTYQWDVAAGGVTTATATALCAGNYDVTVTDNNACSVVFSTPITSINGETIIIVGQNNVTCPTDCDGDVTIAHTCSTGGGSCSLEWLDASNDTIPGLTDVLNPTNLCAGTYYAQLENGVGCITRDTIVITEPDSILANETVTDVTCNGDSDGSVVTAASGGTGAYTYEWDDTSTLPSITAQSAGTYTLTISDALGCDSVFNFTIAEPAVLQITNLGGTDITCFGSNDGTASALASGGTGALTYTWQTCAGANIGQTGTTATGLSAGQYRVEVTDAVGCNVFSNCVTITEPNDIVITTDSTEVNCFAESNGSATATPAGGTGAYTYAWNGAATGQTTPTAVNLPVATYGVTVTDINGCASDTTIDVTGPTDFTLNIVANDVLCFGENTGDATANVIGGTSPYTFLWDFAAGSQITQTADNLVSGTYDVTITDNRGCDTVATASVGTPGELTPVFTIVDEDCSGDATGSVSVAVTGGTPALTYAWSTGSGGTIISGLAQGDYTLTLTDGNACDTVVTATVDGLTPVVVAPTVGDATCGLADGTIDLLVSGGGGGYAYDWRDQIFGPLALVGPNVSGLGAGIYNVIVSSTSFTGGACFDTTNITVNNIGAEILDSVIASPVACFGDSNGMATAYVRRPLVDGPITWSWFDAGSGVMLASTDSFATGLPAGIYNVQVTNNSGCITIGTDTVDTPPALEANEAITDVACFGDLTGAITVTPSGGSGMPYTYVWNTTATTPGIGTLPAGAYSVVISDPSGCDTTYNFTVAQPTQLTAVTDTVNIACNGICDGQAIVTPAGGTAPYVYTWDDPLAQTDSIATGLCADVYEVEIEDANGCQLTPADVEVTEPPVLSASITNAQAVSCFGVCDGIAVATPVGGTQPYTYDWTDNLGVSIGQTDSTATGLCAGTYTANILDANSCQIAIGVVINSPTEITLVLDSVDVTCNGVCDGQTIVTPSGGTAPYNYLWDDVAGQTDSIATGLCPDTYSVDVTDANGCIVASQAIDVNDAPAITALTDFTASNCLQSDGSVVVTPSGGAGNFSYLWDPATGSQTDSMATGVASGAYTVTVTDGQGCTAVFTETVQDNGGPVVDSVQVTNINCFGDNTGAINMFVSGVNNPFDYTWSTGSTNEDISLLPADTFYVTITDQQGCITLDTSIVTQPDSIEIDYTVSLATCNVCNGAIDAEVTGGVMPYAYQWYNATTSMTIGQTDTMATALCIGSYYVEVVDNNGCVVLAPDTSVASPTDLTFLLDSIDVQCAGGSTGAGIVNITSGVMPYGIQWDASAGFQTSDTATSLAAGVYFVTISDQNCTVDTMLSIGEPDSIQITRNITPANCGQNDGSASVNGSGGTGPLTYQWDAATGSQTGTTASNLVAGTYALSVTDSLGCMEVFSIGVPNVDGPVVDSIVVTNLDCHGDTTGVIDLNTSGTNQPFGFLWSNGATTDSLFSLPAGNYFVTITDQQGCITFDTAAVTQPDSIEVAYTVSLATCNVCNGAIDAEVTGGVGGYSYVWYNATTSTAIGQTDTMATALCVGSYYVEVFDANMCQAIAPDTSVASPTDLSFTLDSINVECAGESTGSAIVTINTGVMPYNIQWGTGPTTDTISGLAAGVYLVTVSDANCTVDTMVSVGEPDSIDIARNITPANCLVNDGAATVTGSGGSGPLTYQWDAAAGSQTGPTANNLFAGTYAITVTDSLGCFRVFSVGVPNIDGPVIDTVITTDVPCFGDTIGTITLDTSGTNQPFTFQWSNGAITKDQIDLPAGDYYVTVTDLQGCIALDTATIAEPNALAVSYTTFESTCGQCNGAIDADVTGGTMPYGYQWYNATTSMAIAHTDTLANGLCPDSYFIEVTDNNGCVLIASDTTVTTPDSLTFALDSIAVACAGDSTGAAIVNITNGVLPFGIQWDANAGSQTTDTATGLPAGTYFVTITDANCVVDTMVSVGEPDPIMANTAVTDISCFNLCNGEISATPTGGTGQLTYTWSNGDTDSLITGLCAGIYTLTLTDAAGCSVAFEDTITSPDTLMPSLVATHVLCFGDANGAVTATVTGGGMPYTYDWSTGGTGNIIAGLTAGNYTLTVTDNNGCDSTISISVDEPLALADSFTVVNATCQQPDGSAEAVISGGTAPYTYMWMDNTNLPIGQITPTATGLAAALYKVEVIDANNCADTFNVIVNNIGADIVNADSTDVSCFGSCDGELLANYSCSQPACVLEWYEVPGGTVVGTTDLLTGLCAGEYYAQLENNLGCISIDLIEVIEPDPIQAGDSIVPISCNGLTDGEVHLFPTGGNGTNYGYVWNTGATTVPLTGLAPGDYTVTITEAGPPACDTTYTFTFVDPPVLGATTDSTDVACFGDCNGEGIVTPFGGVAPYSYLWDAAAMNQTDSIATGLCPGTYAVTVTDDAGCTTIPSTVDVNEPTQLTATVTNASSVLCAGQCTGTASVTPGGGTGPYSYLWEAAAGSQTDSTATGLCPGTYAVTITDAGGCTAVDSALIASPLAISASFTLTPVSCNSGCDGVAIVTPAGGTAPFDYLWSDAAGTTDSTAAGLCAGNYNVSVTDNNGCLAIFTTAVAEPMPITATIDTTDANCGMADGAGSVTPAGGNAPYSYMWSDGQTDSLGTGLFAGIYGVTVTDATGCSEVFAVIIGNIDAPEVTLDSLNNTSCVNYTDGDIYLSVTGATAPYSYQWLSGQTTQDIENIGEGNYTVSVSDAAGCITFESYTVTEPDSITAVINTADATCGECNGQAEVNAGGGNGAPFTYLWSNNATAPIAGSLCPGIYSVDVFDNTGCMQSFTNIGVSDIGGPTGDSIVVSPTSCHNTCDGAAALVSVTGGTQPYTYTWIPGGQSTQAINNLCAGFYTLEIEDSLGCSRFSTVEVTSPPAITDSVVIIATECGQSNGSLQLYPENGGIPYSFAWNNGSGHIDDAFSTRDTGLAAGVYVITVTGASGCSDVFSYTLNASDAPILTVASSSTSCNGAADGTATVSATGGTGAYTYQWEDLAGNPIGQTDSTATGLAAGDYVIHVMDAVPCDAYAIVTVEEPELLEFTSPTIWNASCANLCDGEAAVVPTGGTLPYTFQWDAGASNQTTQLANGLCAGSYSISITDANGCLAVDSLQIVEPASMVITEDSIHVATCAVVNDGYIEIGVSGGSMPYTYAWTGPDAYVSDSMDIHQLFAGEYQLNVTDTNGCSALDTFVVGLQVVIIAEAGADTTLCVLQDSVQLFGAELSGNTNVQFQWENLNGDTVASGDTAYVPLTFPMVDSVLILRVFDGACYSTDTVVVTTVGEPGAEAGSDASIIAGTEVEVGPSGGFSSVYTFSWSPNISISDTAAPNPIVAPLETIEYTLTVSDQYGCFSTDSVLITILPEVDFPTGFSPNGDGINDRWVIDFINAYPEARVEVYNRWGQRLFQSPPGYPDPWDGTFNGSPVPVGTYYYIIDLNEPDAPEPLTGPITILR